MAFDYKSFQRGLGGGGSNPFIGMMQTGIAMEQYRKGQYNDRMKLSMNQLELAQNEIERYSVENNMTFDQAAALPQFRPIYENMLEDSFLQKQLKSQNGQPRRHVNQEAPARVLQDPNNPGGQAVIAFVDENGEVVPGTKHASKNPDDQIAGIKAPSEVFHWAKYQYAHELGLPAAMTETDLLAAQTNMGGMSAYGAPEPKSYVSTKPTGMGTPPTQPGQVPESPSQMPATTATPAEQVQAQTQPEGLRTDPNPTVEDYMTMARGRQRPRIGDEAPGGANFQVPRSRPEPTQPEAPARTRQGARGTRRVNEPEAPLTPVQQFDQDMTQYADAAAEAAARGDEEGVQNATDAMRRTRKAYVESTEQQVDEVAEVVKTSGTADPEVTSQNISTEQADATLTHRASGLRKDFYKTPRGRAVVAASMRRMGLLGGDSPQTAAALQNYVRYGSLDKPQTELEKKTAMVDLWLKTLEGKELEADLREKLASGGEITEEDITNLAAGFLPEVNMRMPDATEEQKTTESRAMVDTYYSIKPQIEEILDRAGITDDTERAMAGRQLSSIYHQYLKENTGRRQRAMQEWPLADLLAKKGDIEWWKSIGIDDDASQRAYRDSTIRSDVMDSIMRIVDNMKNQRNPRQEAVQAAEGAERARQVESGERP